MARRVLRKTESDDTGSSRDFKESHRTRFPSTINSSTACSRSEYQASVLPRRGSSPPTHRTSRSIPSGLHREQISRPVSSYATREAEPNPEPRWRLRPEPNPRILKPYEQRRGSKFEAREEYTKEQLSPDRPRLSEYQRRQLPTREQFTEIGSSYRRPSEPYGGLVRQLGRDYNAVSCEPDGYGRSPHREDSKPRHRLNRSRNRKHKEPTKRLRDIFTRAISRRHGPAVEKRHQQPELAHRIQRSSHYDWSSDACRVADRSVTQGIRGETRSRSKRWEMFDNDRRRWMVPKGDCPRYVEGRHASGAKHQAEPVGIEGRRESRRHNHREVRQFLA